MAPYFMRLKHLYSRSESQELALASSNLLFFAPTISGTSTGNPPEIACSESFRYLSRDSSTAFSRRAVSFSMSIYALEAVVDTSHLATLISAFSIHLRNLSYLPV